MACGLRGLTDLGPRIYLFTDDFCWVNDTLTDPQLVDDGVRGKLNAPPMVTDLSNSVLAAYYPNCNLYVDTAV